jgi:hypothetical protein
MVAPDREVPGMRARTWASATPMAVLAGVSLTRSKRHGAGQAEPVGDQDEVPGRGCGDELRGAVDNTGDDHLQYENQVHRVAIRLVIVAG